MLEKSTGILREEVKKKQKFTACATLLYTRVQSEEARHKEMATASRACHYGLGAIVVFHSLGMLANKRLIEERSGARDRTTPRREGVPLVHSA